MGWMKLLIVASACLLGLSSNGLEIQISENEIISESSTVAPEKSIVDWIETLLGLTTTTIRPINEPPKDCPSCYCGLGRKSSRIISGHETKVLEFPWMALLMYNGRYYCGGSLLNDYYVLTAAHCIAGFHKDKVSIRFLEHDLSKPNETKTIDRKAAALIRYPRYNPGTYDNDIALIKLDQRVDLAYSRKRKSASGDGNGIDGSSDFDNDDVRLSPVCLPSAELSYADYNGIVSGWGRIEEGGLSSDYLQEVTVPIISNEECRKTGYKNRITDNMMCAGFPEGGKDACQGDSGGPLNIFNNDTSQFQEVGIVSWGDGCARPNYPGVYTRLNRYLSWIQRNTKDACYCQ